MADSARIVVVGHDSNNENHNLISTGVNPTLDAAGARQIMSWAEELAGMTANYSNLTQTEKVYPSLGGGN